MRAVELKPNFGVGLQPYSLSPPLVVIGLSPAMGKSQDTFKRRPTTFWWMCGPLWATREWPCPHHEVQERSTKASADPTAVAALGLLLQKQQNGSADTNLTFGEAPACKAQGFTQGFTPKSLLSLWGNVLALLVLCPRAQGNWAPIKKLTQHGA